MDKSACKCTKCSVEFSFLATMLRFCLNFVAGALQAVQSLLKLAMQLFLLTRLELE